MVMMPTRGGRRVRPVGESHYQAALKSAVKGRRRQDGVYHVTAQLRREPTNPHDKKAVQVLVSGKVVGHLDRDDARDYEAALIAIERMRTPAECQAIIAGGTKDKLSLGVFLALGTPRDVLKALTTPPTQPAESASNVSPDTSGLPTTNSGGLQKWIRRLKGGGAAEEN